MPTRYTALDHQFDIFWLPRYAALDHQFDIYSLYYASLDHSANMYLREGNQIYVDGVFDGIIIDPTTDYDLSHLSAGSHTITVRPQREYWTTEQIQTYQIDIPGDASPATFEIPAVINFASVWTLDAKVLNWGWTSEVVVDGFHIWFSDTTPVPTGGAPDEIVHYSGSSSYQFNYTGVKAHARISAFLAAADGTESQITLPTVPSVPSAVDNARVEDEE